MKKIERRAIVCVLLALVLAAGLLVFLVKFCLDGGSWASSAFNRHLYDSSGVLAARTGSSYTHQCILSVFPCQWEKQTKTRRFFAHRFFRSL